jgi:bile acid:Na+ symporter, BASS family
MNAGQIMLSLILMTMVFSVALDLKTEDFRRVAQHPVAVIAGLIPQFVLLPIVTWQATLALDLPANLEAAMILVAACPGGALSNVMTHFGRGNAALSVSVSAVASVVALIATPFNFAWMVSSNPATAAWLKRLDIDPQGIWLSLLLLLALPTLLGLLVSHYRAAWRLKLHKPLARFSVLALLVFIAAGLFKERGSLTLSILPILSIVVVHNAVGLTLGWLTATAFRLPVADRRAITIEGGMQNAGLALGIIAVQFGADQGMVTLASLWGIWHIVSGATCAIIWRRQHA